MSSRSFPWHHHAIVLLLTAPLTFAVACGDDAAVAPTSPATQDVGEACDFDSHCYSGLCESFGGQKVCSMECDGDCPAGTACSDGRCAPEDYCSDIDGDGHGVGPGCAGLDCNDANAAINASATERCGNGVDDNCDGAIDESCEGGNNGGTNNGGTNNGGTNNGGTNNGTTGDVCAVNDCAPEADCTPDGATFQCVCRVGYSGDGRTCTAVADPTCGGACGATASCIAMGSGFGCACDDGYAGDGVTCTAVADPTCGGACDAHASCAASGDGYACVCNDGYLGDGLQCALDLTCAGPCDPDASCVAEGEMAVCRCNDGFRGDGLVCADIDECTEQLDDCAAFATCANQMGGFDCTCLPGTRTDADGCTAFGSCRAIHAALPELGDGDYFIDTGVGRPIEVHCDMTSDGGAGYTMVRVDDSALGDTQSAYRDACAALGMEIIVPRTRAHALAISGWLGEVPNIVNVYPRYDGARGLGQWEGRCQGAPCTFWIDDSNNADCGGEEPNGDNNTGSALLRRGAGCTWGSWNDENDRVSITGRVVCSTNDAGPAPLPSCRETIAAGSVHNASDLGISGVYTLSSSAGDYPAFCEMATDGGGWTLALKADGRQTTFSYDAALWTDDNLLAPDAPNVDRVEAKLRSFVELPFTAVLLFMEAPPESGTFHGVQLAASGDSLAAVFREGAVVRTDLGRDAWLALMGSSSIQNNCNLEGFNIGNDGQRVRLGILGNNEDNCDSPDSRLGLGGAGDNCGTNPDLSVGNAARCNGTRNRDRPAFGWLLVR